MKRHYVYMLASKRNGTLYIGITSNLIKRVREHKNDVIAGFTNKYDVHNLVYYEVYNNPNQAIAREKQLKWWKREWKLKIIESFNPSWEDLYEKII